MVKDLNYFPLDVESNIYGMTKLEFDDKTNKILVATLDCRIYCINYNRFKPQTKEVEFTYIPNGAKIISIGTLKRGPNDFVIGITHSLSPTPPKSASNRELIAGDSYNNRQTTYYFNIYASESVSPSFDLDYVAQGCQTLRLRYVPYHLYSTELLSFSSTNSATMEVVRKPIWLLSGGDNNLHAYLEDRPYQSFNEAQLDECFPELCDKQKSIALWIDVANIVKDSSISTGRASVERLIALGFEDGSVKLYHSKLNEATNRFDLIRASSFDSYATIIPCVRLFRINSTNHDSILRRRLGQSGINCDINQDGRFEELNLLIVSSTNSSLIFKDVLNNGLTDKRELPGSQRLDCVTTATIDDTNIDGCNELLLSTHGKELITYQYDRSSGEYVLDDISVLNYPIFAMTILDLTGDGVKDLIVLLASGILIMQTSSVDLMELCRKRVKAVLSALT
uniref:Kaptin n=1 Tax=Aceria tosichella TaxID=561515 RepID=A0A6G1SN71_9ACAR